MQKVATNINSLWKEYKKNPSLKLKQKLVINYTWLVKYVQQTMNLPSNSILDEDDFINIGIIGLHEAIERYDYNRGVKFESYAIPRIKGTIQDELRKLDWLSRSTRKKAQDFLQAGDNLRNEVGREVTPDEIIKKMKIRPSEYKSYLQAAAAAKASLSLTESTQSTYDEEDRSFLDELPDPDFDGIIERIENQERIDFLTSYLRSLNQRKRLIMTLYYFENLTFKEIGKTIKVSESRICQIHSEVVNDLREKLNEFDNA